MSSTHALNMLFKGMANVQGCQQVGHMQSFVSFIFPLIKTFYVSSKSLKTSLHASYIISYQKVFKNTTNQNISKHVFVINVHCLRSYLICYLQDVDDVNQIRKTWLFDKTLQHIGWQVEEYGGNFVSIDHILSIMNQTIYFIIIEFLSNIFIYLF